MQTGNFMISRLTVLTTAHVRRQGSVVVKEVVCEGFSLYEGALIVVKFSYANTQYSIMMNVNGTGGKAVYFPGTTSMSTTATGHIQANGCYLFVYDGTYWRFCGSSKIS